ncbi:Hypothetical predicted protein [Lecanosticta acicola]|uniref:Sexual development protein n=1 Tax=Lecanosticta acicola TaxID=111012 RepID=A0AAI8YVE9_9PEZI|nr:Hypothetical predicted protein [Lecanosticta acicola]
MLPQIAVAALVGLTAAAPTENLVERDGSYASYGSYSGAGTGQSSYGKYASYGSYNGAGASSSGSSQLPIGIGAPAYSAGSFSGPASGSKAQPFKFPLTNGFPNVAMGSQQLTDIEKQAKGTLPNGPLPSKMSDATAANFQVIAFNELWETAFFTSLLQNITDGTYDVGSGAGKQIIVNAITAIQAQEQLHALGANAILQAAGRTTVQPCQYKFPTTDFDSAIALAKTFTDVVVGTLGGAQGVFASAGDDAYIPLIGSVIGQESEQIGYFRVVGGLNPSALPFLTGSSGVFAFSYLNQNIIVPGSCGNLNAIPVPILPALTVETAMIKPADQAITFSYTGSAPTSDMRLVYINQQNTPIVVPISNAQTSGGKTTFQANFPYSANLLNSLTIAAVTKSAGPFSSISAVADAAMYGPGLIEVM